MERLLVKSLESWFRKILALKQGHKLHTSIWDTSMVAFLFLHLSFAAIDNLLTIFYLKQENCSQTFTHICFVFAFIYTQHWQKLCFYNVNRESCKYQRRFFLEKLWNKTKMSNVFMKHCYWLKITIN